MMDSAGTDIQIDQYLDVPRGRVWHAIADGADLGRWFLPNTLEPSLAADFTFTRPQTAGLAGLAPVVHCRVLGAMYASRLTHSWCESAAGVPVTTTVEWTLRSAQRGTQVRLRHSGFAADDPQQQELRLLLEQQWTAAITLRLPAFLVAAAA